ncbi:SDR family NAD(P)-dependent oxidoreductase [Burkholderia cepacia]|uniref:SDR family NAD(P)-dependent oxidoreductase n=1 Tax=Burkholderia cepacia TaxID=292 RepID=UPI002AB6CF45|nr:glucose 1-dehydrogenase [Burkholderia cepacia]
MDQMLSGKIVIITGAARGIGRTAAFAVAKAGASVTLADRDEEAVRGVAEEITADGGSALAVGTDVAREDDVSRAVRMTLDKFGRLDGAFNNAGVEQRNTPLHQLSEAQWDVVIDINLKGVFFCMKHQIAAMLDSGGGSIVNTSSALGRVAIPNASEYCASKGGVLGLTKGAALDYGTRNIRVNAVLPGVIRTPMIDSLVTQPQFSDLLPALEARHPIGRIGKPEEVADAVVWLLSSRSSFVHGAEIAVDGGYLAV